MGSNNNNNNKENKVEIKHSEGENKETIETFDIDIINNLILTVSKLTWKLWKYEGEFEKIEVIEERKATEIYNKKQVIYRSGKISKKNKKNEGEESEINIYIGKIVPGQRSWLQIIKLNTKNYKIKSERSKIIYRNTHHNIMNISKDNKLLVTGTSDGTVTIINSDSLSKLVEVNNVHDFFITDVAFDNEHKFVYSISGDYTCKKTPFVIKRSSKFIFIVQN